MTFHTTENRWKELCKLGRPSEQVLRKIQAKMHAGFNFPTCNMSEGVEAVMHGGCQYGIFVGGRSDGKTCGWLEEMIIQYLVQNRPSAYIRRWAEDIKGHRGEALFAPLGPFVTRCCEVYGLDWDRVVYFRRCFYFGKMDEDGKIIRSFEPFCRAFAISEMEHDKSLGDQNFCLAVFDEFLTRGMYLDDEYVKFKNVISTLGRNGTGGVMRVIMCANSVSKDAPYMDEMPIREIKNCKPGESFIVEGGSLEIDGTKQTLRYYVSMTTAKAAKSKSNKPIDILFASDNPREKMITEGAWEMDDYPHAPDSWKPKHEIVKGFIKYKEDTLEFVVVNNEKVAPFLFIRPKTTEIKDPNSAIIYHNGNDPRPNWLRNILKPIWPWEKYLVQFIRDGRVYYATNRCGETFRDYLRWCGTLMN